MGIDRVRIIVHCDLSDCYHIYADTKVHPVFELGYPARKGMVHGGLSCLVSHGGQVNVG